MSDTTHFGFRDVPLADKQRRVDEVFHKVARRYDLMNDLMSGGLHRAWKDALVTALGPTKSARAYELLDVAGGTGDIAFRTVAAGGPNVRALVADINGDMLAVGRARAQERKLSGRIEFVEANAEALPFTDKRFDAVTIAFGIRNVPRIEAALAQMYRVLKPGGRFLCLEFSKVDVPGLDALYEAYSFHVIPEIGRVVAGDAEVLSLSGGIDPPLPRPRDLRRDDAQGRLWARDCHADERRHRRAPFRLAALRTP